MAVEWFDELEFEAALLSVQDLGRSSDDAARAFSIVKSHEKDYVGKWTELVRLASGSQGETGKVVWSELSPKRIQALADYVERHYSG